MPDRHSENLQQQAIFGEKVQSCLFQTILTATMYKLVFSNSENVRKYTLPNAGCIGGL